MLDCFLGSGTTLIAAEKTGRRAAGMELDPTYVDTALRRWQASTGQEPVHGETGRTFAEESAVRAAPASGPSGGALPAGGEST